MNETHSRQPALHPADLTPSQKALYDAITQGPRSTAPRLFDLVDRDGQLLGPFGGFLLSPEVGDALQELGSTIRFRTRLSDRTRELAILAVAADRESPFERYAHEAVGRACGLSEAEMEAVRRGEYPPMSDEKEAAALRIVRAMLAGDVDDETWAACVPPLDDATVFELIALVGYYSTLALQMKVFRVDLLPASTMAIGGGHGLAALPEGLR